MRGHFFVLVLLAPLVARAQTSLPELPPPAVNEMKAKASSNPKFEDTSGITDIRLRAERGSLSRYSAKLSLGYMGPVIDDLGNPYQPDLDQSVTHNPTSFRGSVAGRYRWNSESAMGFGTGISRVTPFAEGARTDINTPFVSYDHSDRMRAYQLRESVEASLVTNPEMKNCGQFAMLQAMFSVMRNIHYSALEVGIDSNFQYGFFSRGYNPGDPGAVRTASRRGGSRAGISSLADHNLGDGNAQAFSFGFSPNVRYRFSDNVGSFASVQIGYYNPRSAQGTLELRNKSLSGRTGLDIAITKWIFVSPFIGFYPQQLSVSTTTVNFSTILSVL